MMASKKGNNKNRIPVHFVDDLDKDEATATAADQGREENDLDAAGSSAATANDSSQDQSDLPEQERIEVHLEEPGDERPTDGPASTPLTLEGQDFEASGLPPSTEDVGSIRHSLGSGATGPVLAELLATRAELRRIEAERTDLRESLARRQADFENFRKRVDRDRGESYHRMLGDVVEKLLPVLDNLRRALDAESTIQASESEEFRHFLHGVDLIYRQLTAVLQEFGLQPVPALGLMFDPHVHEAIVTEKSDRYEPDTIIQEIVPGYRLGEKLLRPAKVKVAIK